MAEEQHPPYVLITEVTQDASTLWMHNVYRDGRLFVRKDNPVTLVLIHQKGTRSSVVQGSWPPYTLKSAVLISCENESGIEEHWSIYTRNRPELEQLIADLRGAGLDVRGGAS